MSVRRSLSVLLASLLLLPSLVFARPITQIVDIKADTVTRADFLSWTVEALELPKTDVSCELPYVRFPRGLKGTLCAAQDRGVLVIFGTEKRYTLGQVVTRGEALSILMALTGKHDDTTDVSQFKDVRSERDKQAVRSAIAFKWMVPMRATLFGVARPLSGTETLSLLQAAIGENVAEAQGRITFTFSTQPAGGTLPKQQLLDTIWEILKRDYLHSEKIDSDEAAYKAAEALVNSLGDPYTTFFRPASANNFQDQLNGELSGIGAQVEDKGGVITVVSPIPNSPADRAGIRPGDEILEANGHLLTGIGVDRAVQFIRGERGSSVILKIRRSGVEMTLTLVRDTVSIPEIDVKWQGDIAIVTLAQFGQTTDKQIRSIFTDIQKQNPKGIVLDLRNNGGGLLHASSMVMSNFVPRDTIVAKVESATETRDERTEFGPTISLSTKLVVLVNKASASASEIVAGALQDLKRATIVGTTTFGKGTVQEILSFSTGEALKITIAEWHTPLGRKLDGIGVKPDVVVNSESRDEQMSRALELLR